MLIRETFYLFVSGVIASNAAAAELNASRPTPPRIAPASPEAELAIKGFTVAPGFRIELFAAEPMLAHPVAFAIDEQNRVYVAESFRVGEQVTDIRRHMTWLDEELASTNTAQFRRLIEKYLDPKFMTVETERISLLEDTDRDGRADKSVVFADGFNEPTSGIAAGVLARKGDVWFTCIPDLWRLRDLDGDGRVNLRQSIHSGFAVRFGFYGHDLHGLRIGPDGKLYFSIGDRGFNVVSKERKRLASPETGAVLRCNWDGSDLEIFATGLRNPQELAFDQYGNLFTGDNNSDGGDQARWTYVVEGGDSGWRIGWQFLTWPVPRGPWNAEKMWHPQNDEQPAYLVPPVANFANGPSGLTFYPGTGLPAAYANQFFMCDFRGTANSSFIHSFGVKPEGASFELVDLKPFVSHMVATDVEFGMDGAIYTSDWVEGWGRTGKGRIYRVVHPESVQNADVNQTRELMARGFERLEDSELVSLLSWPDQRVRQESQFELAARGKRSAPLLSEVARASTNQPARLHAIWGLGQIHAPIAKRDAQIAAQVLRPLVPLLEDSDEEVRAQAVKVFGQGRYARARGAMERLVVDSRSPRVQFFAAMALGKLGDKRSSAPVIEMLRHNADKDAYLRHAGVMALYWISNRTALARASSDSSPAVRMAALLVYRRLNRPELAKFLHDPEPRIVVEAARAIYDLPVHQALPELAALLARPRLSGPLLRRAINANYRIGDPASARALVKLAAAETVSESARIEALTVLGDWAKPSGRDRITGLWRPIPERNARVAAEAVGGVIPQLLANAPDGVRAVAARLAARYEISEAGPALVTLAKSPAANEDARIESLRALVALRYPSAPQILESIAEAAASRVRNEAIRLLVQSDPESGAKRLGNLFESGNTIEQQFALGTLGDIDHPAAAQALDQWLQKFLHGDVHPSLHLELTEAAENHRNRLQTRLDELQKALAASDLGEFGVALVGGNASEGAKIFFERAEASCSRCHKVGGVGGDAGPALDDRLIGRSRAYLLESIIAPNKEIAAGYENVIVKLKNGAVYAGTVTSETASELVIHSPEEGGPVTIAKADIESRQRGASGMPDGIAAVLSKRELRDLVEFLAKLGQR